MASGRSLLGDTVRLVARTGRDAARRVPVIGSLFGRAPRLELDGRDVFVTRQRRCDGESRCIA
jgi:hypothetical protein